MASAQGSWVWRKWQLVHVEQVAETFVLDVIELSDHPDDSGGLISFTFDAPKGRLAALRELRRLSRWVARDDGVCAAHAMVDCTGAVTLVQGDERIDIPNGPGAA